MEVETNSQLENKLLSGSAVTEFSYSPSFNFIRSEERAKVRARSTFTTVENFFTPTRVHLKVPPLESAAINRLIDAILDAEQYGYGPDIIVKVFADLDLVFFDGRLRGNVCVECVSDKYFQKWRVPPGAWGFTVRPQLGESGQCRVKLNAKTILLDLSTDTPFKTMFGTMLHEMCHAYEHIRCFPEDCDPGDGHDKHFRTKIHAVHRRAYHLLGLWAIDKRESYREDHFMSREWSGEWRDMYNDKKGQSSKEGNNGVRVERSEKVEVNKGQKRGGQVEGVTSSLCSIVPTGCAGL